MLTRGSPGECRLIIWLAQWWGPRRFRLSRLWMSVAAMACNSRDVEAGTCARRNSLGTLRSSEQRSRS
jgi:hypothetical protein